MSSGISDLEYRAGSPFWESLYAPLEFKEDMPRENLIEAKLRRQQGQSISHILGKLSLIRHAVQPKANSSSSI